MRTKILMTFVLSACIFSAKADSPFAGFDEGRPAETVAYRLTDSHGQHRYAEAQIKNGYLQWVEVK